MSPLCCSKDGKRVSLDEKLREERQTAKGKCALHAQSTSRRCFVPPTFGNFGYLRSESWRIL
jgi:hypothetical protein